MTHSAGVGGDDFTTTRAAAAKIGAEQAPPTAVGIIRPGRFGAWTASAQRETNLITDETHQAFTRCGCHGWHRQFHWRFFLARNGEDINRKSALAGHWGTLRGFGRGPLPATFKLAGKLLKTHVLPHVLGENGVGEFRGMATATLNASEEAQLQQTIEMFEVIVQSQPNDCQSLEILKEAYTKLGREQEVINTSKRIAQAYLQMGQLSSAILEYETVLQRRPNDADVQSALKQIEDKANNVAVQQIVGVEPTALTPSSDTGRFRKKTRSNAAEGIDDGRKAMHKVFVEGRIINAGDFDLWWRSADLSKAPSDVVEPFINALSEKGVLPVEKSLKLLSDKSRLAYLPLDKYEVDMEMARGFPMAICRRWCLLPFDRMSKAILVATANPFNQQAAKELAETTTNRLLWYLASPTELMQNIRKAFR